MDPILFEFHDAHLFHDDPARILQHQDGGDEREGRCAYICNREPLLIYQACKTDMVIHINILELTVCVSTRLAFYNCDVLSGIVFLRFNNANWFSYYEQSIIHRPCACWIFSNSNT